MLAGVNNSECCSLLQITSGYLGFSISVGLSKSALFFSYHYWQYKLIYQYEYHNAIQYHIISFKIL